MEQDVQAICTINKDCNQISNQDLITQKKEKFITSKNEHRN